MAGTGSKALLFYLILDVFFLMLLPGAGFSYSTGDANLTSNYFNLSFNTSDPTSPLEASAAVNNSTLSENIGIDTTVGGATSGIGQFFVNAYQTVKTAASIVATAMFAPIVFATVTEMPWPFALMLITFSSMLLVLGILSFVRGFDF